jgi:hypothetical protein
MSYFCRTQPVVARWMRRHFLPAFGEAPLLLLKPVFVSACSKRPDMSCHLEMVTGTNASCTNAPIWHVPSEEPECRQQKSGIISCHRVCTAADLLVLVLHLLLLSGREEDTLCWRNVGCMGHDVPPGVTTGSTEFWQIDNPSSRNCSWLLVSVNSLIQ